MESADYCSLILYYGRARFFHSMQKTSLDGLAKYPTQIIFRLYNGFALALGNRVQEGIRELNPLKNERDLSLSAIHALIYAHKRCSVVDRDAIQSLEQKLHDEREEGMFSAMSAYYAAVFHSLIACTEQAQEYVDKALKLDSQLEPALILKAWTELTHRASVNGNVLRIFELALMHGRNIDATLGQVRYFQLKNQYQNAITALNKLSVRFPELSIPLIEKMETNFAALDWDQTFETSLRIINLEPPNIFALRVKALLLVIRDSNMKEGVSTIQLLFTAVERIEVGNNDLLLDIAQLFARVCSRDHGILALTIRHVEKLKQLNANNIAICTELGYQWLMMGKIDEAAACFRSATKMDDNYFLALCGLTLCQILQTGVSEQVRQQIEFLKELRVGHEREPLLNYLEAKIAAAHGQGHDQAIALLIEANEMHMKRVETLTFGAEYMRLLNPDFLLQIAAELIRYSPIETNVKLNAGLTSETIHISLRHCLNILEVVLRACPGHANALFMRAKVEFSCGEVSKASATLHRMLTDVGPAYTDAQLLLAQMQIQQQQLPKAMQSLEMALSHNFAVRESPMYHLLIGVIQKQQQQLSEAQKSFLAAMQLVGSSYVAGGEQSNEKVTMTEDPLSSFTNADKVTLYLELMDVFRRIGDAQSTYESERLLQCAMEEFSNTAEEGRLIIAHADLLLQNCKVSKAISLLAAVQPNQSYYIQAKTHLAHIYLEQRKDRVAFAKCFKELVAACPEPESYLMLGEAYISIQEPNLAVEAYQTASNLNPHDSLLASKLGRAYVKTHQYNKAIKYYQEALKSYDYFGLRLDLAELYLKLRQYQNAINTLVNNMEKKIDEDDITALQLRTKELLLLARVYEKSGNIPLSVQTLQDARENQYRVQKRISVDHQSGNLYEQYKILSKICLQMAQQSISLRDNNEALKCLKECLKYTPNDVELLSSLARLHMTMNSMDLCSDACLQILQIDSSNETASVMMADISFRKMEFDNAAYHFSQLLLLKPNYWIALARMIEVMRRSGTLQEAGPFLQRAEQMTANATQSCGLNYCKGLYEWYSGNPNTALRNFASARRDHEWGQQAIFNMIEICINPDCDIPNSNGIQDGLDSAEFSESRTIALRTAERLLKELRPRPGGIDNEALNHRLLHNFLQLATKQKFQIESALQDFTDLANVYQNMIGPILGMASASVQLKQTQRAKNHLKRIARVPWNFEEAEYLERSWLLLADIYIHANKYDVAESFCDRVLEHNKSCAKAYELKGIIAEKTQVYREAAKHFHNAWNYCGRSKPNIGYKLAYNHMKTKRYADAIDVCQQVGKLHPDYVIIRKDILEKCRNNLRP